MKKRILLITFILLGFGIKAQNTFPTTGNVGIGTANPGAEIHLSKSINGELSLLIQNTYGIGTRTFITSVPNKSLIQTDRDFGIFTNGGGWSEKFSLSNSGNVGIGTTTPQSLLEIGNYNSNETITIASGQNGTGSIYFRDNNASEGAGIKVTGVSGGGKMEFFNRWNNDETKVMFDLNTGNVGIGTTTPDSKLSVNGKIHAKEVKVDLTGWPDYVFASTYKLPTLKEVEKHINQKGHLKDIPSAKEVAENGILLGEMNKKLLQKIEELTLYAIQQEKSLKIQNTKIEKQAKELKYLRNLSIRIANIEKRLNK